MRERRAELDARGATVVLIGFEAARRQQGYCRRQRIGDWRCAVDEPRKAYRAYGLGRLPWRRTFSAASVWGYVRFWHRGKRAARPKTDVRQAGGDFVVNPEGRLALVHPGRDPHDRPSVDVILGVMS